jgi:hypothetical protein
VPLLNAVGFEDDQGLLHQDAGLYPRLDPWEVRNAHSGFWV